MQDNTPLSIHEASFSLGFLQIKSSEATTKLLAHIEDRETIAIQFNMLFLSAGRDQLFLCKTQGF